MSARFGIGAAHRLPRTERAAMTLPPTTTSLIVTPACDLNSPSLVVALTEGIHSPLGVVIVVILYESWIHGGADSSM